MANNKITDKFIENNKYELKVVTIKPSFVVLVDEKTGLSGICHISEISDYYIKDIKEILNLSYKYTFLCIEVSDKKNVFSYKRINPKFLKQRDKIIPTSSGYKNLLNFLHSLLS
ncbi:hypothetical protein FACS189459_5710 [Bacilli bacterium]|nr:hypothetical protein FACS189459_5710 [Bacilli bacterium]